MSCFLIYAYLFYLGSSFGWVLELLFRKFFSASNPEHKWINPGFCVGPYVPLYGFGLCILYGLATLFKGASGLGAVTILILMAAAMTLLEYLTGLVCLKLLKVRLWDYSHLWGNVQGLICPAFSVAWGALCAIYYFFVYPYTIKAIVWLSENLAFSFVIGFFFGVFTIDVVYSTKMITKLRAFAREHKVIVRYEAVKANIRSAQDEAFKKAHFLFPFISDEPLHEHLKSLLERVDSENKHHPFVFNRNRK